MNRKILFCLLSLLLPSAIFAISDTGIDNSLTKEIYTSAVKGQKFLSSKQLPNGSWGPWGGHPAYTAIVVNALLANPNAQKPEVKQSIDKAVDYILKFVQKDGSIWMPSERQYPNYTTSLALVALYNADKTKHSAVILNGRRFLKASQFGPETGDNEGGIGYGSNKTKSDLSNTQLALEALYITEDVEKEKGTDKDRNETRKAWQKATEFIKRTQAVPGNKQDWVKDAKPEDMGGFVYSPDRSMSKNEDGSLRTYGSMTYAGLKSMIYAQLKADDPRVKAAISWVAKNYTVDENPGMKLQGHYYYIHTFAKALNAYGANSIKDAKGVNRMWRKDVSLKLIKMQKADGHWVNPVGRWQENDPILCTGFALLALNQASYQDISALEKGRK